MLITTETWRGHLTRIAISAARSTVAGALAFAVLRGGVGLGGGAALAVSAFVGLGALMLLLPGLTDRLERRGTWHVTAAGIRFHPFEGQSRSMSFSDVEQVRWGARTVRLRDAGGTLTVGSPLLGRKAWSDLREALARRLGARFAVAAPEPDTAWDRFTASPALTRAATELNVALLAILAGGLGAAGEVVWPVAAVLVAAALLGLVRAIVERHHPWLDPLDRGVAGETRRAA